MLPCLRLVFVTTRPDVVLVAGSAMPALTSYQAAPARLA
jgi:hypothetical protein